MIELNMKNYSAILIGKQQNYQKITKSNWYIYQFFTGEDILSSDQSRIIQAKFTCSPLGKPFEKQK